MSSITLGGGCFWCLDAVYRRVPGVTEVVSGYAGGHARDPSYEEVCTGRTGHAEVVRLTYDPEVVSARQILQLFFAFHDPTTVDRQGADVGSQYRSIILYHDEDQRREAERLMDELAADGVYDAPIVTTLAPLTDFYPAELDHQDYYTLQPSRAYCRVVISPKVAKLREALTQLGLVGVG